MKNPSNSAVETRIPPLGFVSRNWREGDKFRSSARNSIVRRELWAYVSAIACEIFSTGSLSGNAFTSAVSLYLLSVHEKVSDWSCQTLLNWACIACRPWNDWLTFEVLTPGLPRLTVCWAVSVLQLDERERGILCDRKTVLMFPVLSDKRGVAALEVCNRIRFLSSSGKMKNLYWPETPLGGCWIQLWMLYRTD